MDRFLTSLGVSWIPYFIPAAFLEANSKDQGADRRQEDNGRRAEEQDTGDRMAYDTMMLMSRRARFVTPGLEDEGESWGTANRSRN